MGLLLFMIDDEAMDEKMNILYTIDNHFIPQLCAGICAICENNRQEDEVAFFVISQGLSDDDEATIRSLCARYDRDIHFYSVEDLLSQFDAVDTGAWRKIIMARLLMGSILPCDIHRVLYLDGDTLVLGPLKQLWEIGLGECCLGAVAEPTIDPRRKKALGLSEGDLYINSGVMLVDLDRWRRQNVESRLISFCQENAEVLFASDQDAINVVLKGEIYYLTPNYNFCNSFYIYPYCAIRKMISPAQYFDEKSYVKSLESPRIVHFLGEDRPWRKGSTHRFRKDYFEYLSMTPYANQPLEEGWELYYRIWSLFNFVTKPFPMLRLQVINRLIPFMKRIRKKQQGI